MIKIRPGVLFLILGFVCVFTFNAWANLKLREIDNEIIEIKNIASAPSSLLITLGGGADDAECWDYAYYRMSVESSNA